MTQPFGGMNGLTRSQDIADGMMRKAQESLDAVGLCWPEKQTISRPFVFYEPSQDMTCFRMKFGMFIPVAPAWIALNTCYKELRMIQWWCWHVLTPICHPHFSVIASFQRSFQPGIHGSFGQTKKHLSSGCWTPVGWWLVCGFYYPSHIGNSHWLS